MKIDEFLTAQAQGGFELPCTVEQVTDNPDLVRVTPRVGGACGCDRSFTVKKEDVLKIESMNQQISCCGKYLQVARITLREKAPIPVEDVLAMVQRHSDPTPEDRPSAGYYETGSTERRRLDCPKGTYPECDPDCQGPGERCCVCVPVDGFRSAISRRSYSNRNCELACRICHRFPWKTGPCSVCDACSSDS